MEHRVDTYMFVCGDDMVAVTLMNESCSPQWETISRTYGGNGYFATHSIAQTPQQCQDACLFNPRCTAVSYVFPPYCFLYTTFVISSHGSYYTYKLVNRCNVTSGLYLCLSASTICTVFRHVAISVRLMS